MKIKVFTQVNRCNLFLDIWLEHYLKITEQDNIHIYYQNMFGQDIFQYLSDRGFDELNVTNVNTIYSLKYFNEVQKELLKDTDVLLYADPDELIYSSDLGKVVNSFDGAYVSTTGFEVIHNLKEEEDYDSSKPIMEQRSYGLFSDSYHKPIVLKQPLKWDCTGKHSRRIPIKLVDDLYLIHLCRFDFNTLLELNRENFKTYTGNRRNCWHHLIHEKQKLEEYYETYFLHKLIKIPSEIKDNLKI